MLDPFFHLVFGIMAWSLDSIANFIISVLVALLAAAGAIATLVKWRREDQDVERRRAAYFRSRAFRSDDV